MQLNKNQIESLFVFVEKKGVEYYDVQHEIVDHLATSIESEMIKSKNTSFDQALQKVYSAFPITGFAQYTVDLEKSLWTFWKGQILSSVIKNWIPLIGFISLLTVSIYFMTMVNENLVIDGLYYGCIALGMLAFITFFRQFGKSGIEMLVHFGWASYIDKLDYKLLYYNVLKSVTLVMVIGSIVLSRITSIFIIDQSLQITTSISFSVLLFSILTAISISWSLAVIFYYPNMIRKVISEKYNHVVIA